MAFRRVELPSDPARFNSLEELGYCIDENDKIVRIDDPNKGYHFKANKNPRYMQTRHEDFEAACRRVIESRLLAEDVRIGYIPCVSGVDPYLQTPEKPQAPVFFSNFINTPEKCERLILLVGSSDHDPHTVSHNILETHGINAGSIVDFVKDAHTRDRMGVIIANPGQCLWSRTLQKAVTYASYDALPRDKATDPSPAIGHEGSYVFGSDNTTEHLSALFNDLVIPTIKGNRRHPELYILCNGNATHDTLQFMQSKWAEFKTFTAAIVICNGTIDKSTDLYHPEFIQFWSERCKNYWSDSQPIDTPIEVVTGIPNYFSSGKVDKRQNVFHQVYGKALDYFDHIHHNPKFQLPTFVPVVGSDDIDAEGEDNDVDVDGWVNNDEEQLNLTSQMSTSGKGVALAENGIAPDSPEPNKGSK